MGEKKAKNFCPNCGNPVEAHHKFCGNCGAPLTEPKVEKEVQRESILDTSNNNYQLQYQPTSTVRQIPIAKKPKSRELAALLTFLFGPFGFLYISAKDFLLTFLVAIVVSLVTFGYGVFILWIVWPFWGSYAAKKWNEENITKTSSIKEI